MNYLQNEYNLSRHFLEISLHYGVKHKSSKMLQLLCSTNSRLQLCRTFVNRFEKHM